MFGRFLGGLYDPYDDYPRRSANILPSLQLLDDYPRRSANILPSLQLLDDYISPPHVHFNVIRPRRQNSEVSERGDARQCDANQFQVMLNVKHFRPDEIDVKMVDNFVVIHGRHEEHADEHGFVSREFTRRYQLPDDVEPDTVKSSLSQDGVLRIQAPRKALEPPPKNERIVPITIQQPAAVEAQQQMQEQAQSAEEPKQ